MCDLSWCENVMGDVRGRFVSWRTAAAECDARSLQDEFRSFVHALSRRLGLARRLTMVSNFHRSYPQAVSKFLATFAAGLSDGNSSFFLTSATALQQRLRLALTVRDNPWRLDTAYRRHERCRGALYARTPMKMLAHN